ncbi:transposase [Allofranklinella schreckenbergeri]|uniref:Transposase n=1 Tax=Allofranklinella schreckenbergeri TaxID=1076744 RepID=A0A3M6Q3P2_9BURK|nr:transposase [Allofranklinella schreckenbergeri]
MRQRTYPSDISREQFKQILPILEQARKRTKPPTVDLYEVFCAVLYLLRTGCQWRALPSDFPKWRTVYAYFAKCSEVEKNTRLWKNCERLLNTRLQFIHLAFLALILKRS